MRFNTLFFLLSLSCLCFALAQVSYEDCCLKYVTKKDLHRRPAVKYRMQETDGGCNIRAVVFSLKRGRMVCANPNDEWVKKLVNKIDKQNASVDKSNKKDVSQIKRG